MAMFVDHDRTLEADDDDAILVIAMVLAWMIPRSGCDFDSRLWVRAPLIIPCCHFLMEGIYGRF